MQEPPAKLLTLSGIAILLGAFGVLLFLSGMISTARGYTPAIRPPQKTEHIQDLQRQMRVEIASEIRKWKSVQTVVQFAVLAGSIGLIIGGISAIRLKNPAHKILRTTMIFLIPIEISQSFLGFIFARASISITMKYMSQIMSANQHGNPLAPNLQSWVTGIGNAASYVGLLFGLVLLAGKFIYYIVSIRYFNQSDIQALFEHKVVPPPLPSRRL